MKALKYTEKAKRKRHMGLMGLTKSAYVKKLRKMLRDVIVNNLLKKKIYDRRKKK